MKRASTYSSLMLFSLLVGCGQERSPQARSPGGGPAAPVPVLVATAATADVPITLRAIGSVEAQAAVTIRPQVSAQVKSLDVSEGTDVRAGDVLVRLDERPFLAAIAQAEAQLAKDRALAADARRTAERFSSALGAGGASQNEAEAAIAQADAAEAQADADQAMLDRAKLDLSYCAITAPWEGRLGRFMVRPGAIVESNKTDLVDLTRIAPIDVSFSVPEDHLTAVRSATSVGAVPVHAWIGAASHGQPPTATGSLSFIDNRVDAATGSIRLKATFDNQDRALWPGQFVNVVLVLGTDAGAIVVPDAAVQPSQQGDSVYVVKGDQSVEVRPVSVRRSQDGQSVITSGLAPGETVITDGHLRVAPGSRVQPRSSGGPAPAQTPAASLGAADR